MAIMTPGPTVGQVSGRIGGIIYSRNRGGAYIRNGSMPTTSTTIYAQAAKALLALTSASWAILTPTQQLAWKTWSTQNPVTNRLGMQHTLSPHAAFVQVNSTILLAGGVAIAIPPVIAPPIALASLSVSASIAGPIAITFAASPIGANNVLFINAAISDNPGVAYVRNLYKLVLVSAANDATPTSIGAAVATRFGTLQPDQHLFVNVQVVDQVSGLRSGPITADVVLTA